jgi:hypothetical protein
MRAMCRSDLLSLALAERAIRGARTGRAPVEVTGHRGNVLILRSRIVSALSVGKNWGTVKG